MPTEARGVVGKGAQMGGARRLVGEVGVDYWWRAKRHLDYRRGREVGARREGKGRAEGFSESERFTGEKDPKLTELSLRKV